MKGLLFLLILAVAGNSLADTSFRKSKVTLSKKIYHDYKRSFYCECDFSLQPKLNGKGDRLTPDWKSCGYKPRKQAKRASRIEWEHVMPAHHFGQHMACWKKGGRKACKKDKAFKRMAADMHNLVPAVGEVNGDRSNYKFGIIAGEKRSYGKCDVEVDFKAKRAEPAPDIRGEIARTYSYMSDRYNIRLSKQQRKLMQAWDKQDPVSKWERTRNKRIGKVQGNLNPYIK